MGGLDRNPISLLFRIEDGSTTAKKKQTNCMAKKGIMHDNTFLTVFKVDRPANNNYTLHHKYYLAFIHQYDKYLVHGPLWALPMGERNLAFFPF